MRSINVQMTAILLISGPLNLLSAPLALADEPRVQTAPSTGAGGEVGTASGAQEPASTAPPPETSDIQERGVLPGRVAPNALLRQPGLTVPAPTPTLTAIRNAMKVTSKSVSVNLRIPPNLPVTVPVEVSVAYISPAKTQSLTRTYNPATGLTFSYREAEGDGKPRAMTLDITVRELVPNGKSFAVGKQFTVTPLYDVFITDLIFFMSSPCDRFGKSDITFSWFSPDGQRHDHNFKVGLGNRIGIPQFSWTRKEVSMQATLREPTVYFNERDPVFPDYTPPIDRSGTTLVPGPTIKHHFFLKEETTGPPGQQGFGGGCTVKITYTIIRALMPFDQFRTGIEKRERLDRMLLWWGGNRWLRPECLRAHATDDRMRGSHDRYQLIDG